MTRAILMMGVVSLLTTGCANYTRDTVVAENDAGRLEHKERVSAFGLFNSASLEKASSSTTVKDGQYSSQKGLSGAQTSGNAELVQSITELLKTTRPTP